ncbi:hypothetical protein FCM35_KLT10508 [Carex littledalei]|uniref:Uncharacterized protein n=1 Tax=Carex littledalei TaxID=544730 RepID=A0A833V5T8_9POAL|nr:hypothetical protein FCM35_KLT10508 [Carex littledalei]
MEVLSNPISCFSQGALIRSSRNQQQQITCLLLRQEKQRTVPGLHVGFKIGARLRAQPLDMVILGYVPPEERDLSVMIPVSALLFFFYWIANWVVPSFIMKDLEKDETPEDKTSS